MLDALVARGEAVSLEHVINWSSHQRLSESGLSERTVVEINRCRPKVASREWRHDTSSFNRKTPRTRVNSVSSAPQTRPNACDPDMFHDSVGPQATVLTIRVGFYRPVTSRRVLLPIAAARPDRSVVAAWGWSLRNQVSINCNALWSEVAGRKPTCLNGAWRWTLTHALSVDCVGTNDAANAYEQKSTEPRVHD